MATTHRHRHYHGADSGAPNLDGAGYHAHEHHHGQNEDGKPQLDNSHGHGHDDVVWPPGEDPGSTERPGTAAGYRRHIRFAHGGAAELVPGQVFNSARRPDPWQELMRLAAEAKRHGWEIG